MAIISLRTGQHTILRTTELRRPESSVLTTQGIGDCVALAICGESDDGPEVFFSHLHSYQYSCPKFGGCSDSNDKTGTVTAMKKFLREHQKNLVIRAASNFKELGAFARLNIIGRYGIKDFDLRFLNMEGNSGKVSLDAKKFEMYKGSPDQICENTNIDHLELLNNKLV